MEATLFRLVLALKTKCFATEARIQEQRSLTPAEFNGLPDAIVGCRELSGKPAQPKVVRHTGIPNIDLRVLRSS